MIDLAVVIVSWNIKTLLAGCLASVRADLSARGLSGEIWVVDNASRDGSAEMVRRDFPEVRLIAAPKNLGFAGGNNAALRAMGFGAAPESPPALPAAVLLLNPDTEVQAGALPALFNFLRDHPQVGIVGPSLVYGDGSFQHSAFAFPGLWQLAIELLPLPGRLVESRFNGRYPPARYRQGRPFAIGHPLGAAMAVRREAIQQAGLLDESYHMYVEEVDWAKRIQAAGWPAYCLPTATITHFGGQSTAQIKSDSFLNLWRSRYLFYKTYYPPWRRWLASQIVVAGMRRKLKALAANPAEVADLQPCLRQVINIWQGKDQTL
jgi:hypothetical protein